MDEAPEAATRRHEASSLLAYRIVSVQPMTAPVGWIMFYRPRYASSLGSRDTPLLEATKRIWAEEDDADQIGID